MSDCFDACRIRVINVEKIFFGNLYHYIIFYQKKQYLNPHKIIIKSNKIIIIYWHKLYRYNNPHLAVSHKIYVLSIFQVKTGVYIYSLNHQSVNFPPTGREKPLCLHLNGSRTTDQARLKRYKNLQIRAIG